MIIRHCYIGCIFCIITLLMRVILTYFTDKFRISRIHFLKHDTFANYRFIYLKLIIRNRGSCIIFTSIFNFNVCNLYLISTVTAISYLTTEIELYIWVHIFLIYAWLFQSIRTFLYIIVVMQSLLSMLCQKIYRWCNSWKDWRKWLLNV